MNYGRRAHCLSFTHVAPRHVIGKLLMDVQSVKSENPELKIISVPIFYLTSY